MKLKDSHWTNKDGTAGVVISETDTTVTIRRDSGHTEELDRDDLLRDWTRVTSPDEARPQARR